MPEKLADFLLSVLFISFTTIVASLAIATLVFVVAAVSQAFA